MPNRTIGRFIHHLLNARRVVAKHANAHHLSYVVARLVEPFDIDPSVEIRTPSQISIERESVIRARAILNGRSSTSEFGITLGEQTYIKEGCYLDAYGGSISIGGFCAFAQNTFIHGGGGVAIGTHVIVGPDTYIIASNHNYGSRELPIMLQGESRRGIAIGSNVWLGASVVVLDGVRIGDNSVVGAGTVLTHDVPRNTVVYDKRLLGTHPIFT